MPRLPIGSFVLPMLLALPLPAAAQGDAARGEREFNKCRSCHMIEAPDGTEIFRGGRTGPNLYGIIGQPAGAAEGFRYSPSMVAAGEAGLVWDAENLRDYLADPTAFLRAHLGDPRARSNMAFRLTSGADDVIAYLESVAQ
ncbi:c-type cytochrome [Halodurantibacterium flavum]|uniref:C-type cytochrome n=1 Tax=Halodurantibacterium flavum TaxID=1382802 RepID=A0ABW4S5D7_9RHOB